MKKVSRGTKARKLTANEQILNRLAELGERMRVIEDDIERAQKHLGRLAIHQGAVTALLPKLRQEPESMYVCSTHGFRPGQLASCDICRSHALDALACTGPGSN